MAELDAESAAARPREALPYSEVGKGYTVFRDGDLLLAKITPCWENGKIGQASLDREIGVGSTEFHVVRPAPQVDARYLMRFLRTESVRATGELRMTGSGGQRRVPVKYLQSLEVPLPPLDEQRRIAAILDHADALRAKRRRILAHLDDLTQSTFVDMFGHPVTGSRCPRAAVGSIAEVRTGNSPSRAIPENFGDAIEWVKSDNLAGGFVERASEGLSARGKSVARIAPAGSVLVTCIAGSAASIGRAAVADREVAFNQQINAVLPSGDIHPYFLLTQFKVAPDLVRAKSTGGMKGMVSKSAFQAIQILLPPLGDQREFAKRMERVFALRARVEGLVRLDDELFASLQSRAFKGEL